MVHEEHHEARGGIDLNENLKLNSSGVKTQGSRRGARRSWSWNQVFDLERRGEISAHARRVECQCRLISSCPSSIKRIEKSCCGKHRSLATKRPHAAGFTAGYEEGTPSRRVGRPSAQQRARKAPTRAEARDESAGKSSSRIRGPAFAEHLPDLIQGALHPRFPQASFHRRGNRHRRSSLLLGEMEAGGPDSRSSALPDRCRGACSSASIANAAQVVPDDGEVDPARPNPTIYIPASSS